jgi:hypothetical protein
MTKMGSGLVSLTHLAESQILDMRLYFGTKSKRHTNIGTRSTRKRKLGSWQRCFKKAIRDVLVTAFPEGYSLTRTLASRRGETGSVFTFRDFTGFKSTPPTRLRLTGVSGKSAGVERFFPRSGWDRSVQSI